jgi:hypothetical protein
MLDQVMLDQLGFTTEAEYREAVTAETEELANDILERCHRHGPSVIFAAFASVMTKIMGEMCNPSGPQIPISDGIALIDTLIASLGDMRQPLSQPKQNN